MWNRNVETFLGCDGLFEESRIVLFGVASKKRHPVKDVNWVRWNALGLKTRYYNTQLHAGAFALPNYGEEMLRDVEPES